MLWGRTVAGIPEKMCESGATLQKFSIPLDQATTSSLQAQQVVSLGNREQDKHGAAATIPFFRTALES
jgi:hypothetical protein